MTLSTENADINGIRSSKRRRTNARTIAPTSDHGDDEREAAM